MNIKEPNMKHPFYFLFSAMLVLLSCGTPEAKWITADNTQNSEPNTWIEFQKDFNVGRVPAEVLANIAADSKYWLWINGEEVVFEGSLKRGPNPTDSYYDEVDIAPFLHKGENELKILLCHFGKEGFSHKNSGKSGLIFDASEIGLVSDSTWNSAIVSAYQKAENPGPNYRLAESNIRFDSRLKGTDIFKPSIELGLWNEGPWGKLHKRPIPMWKNSGIISATYETRQDDNGNIVLAVRLPYNMHMTPYIDVTDNGEGTCIRLETDHIWGGSDDCIRAEYITSKGRQCHESLGWMNGEELRVIYPSDAAITVHSIGYRETGYGCEREGSFRCSDEMINRFWEKAMRTLYVNMRDTYFDCPDRERAQWWGDVTVLIGQSFYQLSPEANKLMYKGIHELVDWQKESGVLYSPVPAGNWFNELPAQMLASVGPYGFWYYYMNTGDKETISYVYPSVRRYLDLWKLDEEGLTEYRKGDWSWGDWGSNIDIRLLLAAWHYMALDAASQMAELTGNSADIEGYQTIRKSIHQAFNKCWTGKFYRHHTYTGSTDDRVNAMAILSGIADESKFDAIFELFKTTEHASPYMEKYVLETLVKTGHADYALERFKKRFGVMINDTYNTTLYEAWTVGSYGGGSTNHAWSGGMLTVIAENICGVRPTEPGWKSFEVCPIPLFSECEIVIPSVAGKIESSFKDNEKEFVLTVTVPQGCKANVKLPSAEYTSVSVNGKSHEGKLEFSAGTYNICCTK